MKTIRLLIGILTCVASTIPSAALDGQESFQVLATDAANQRLIRVTIETGSGGVATEQNASLDLSFSPTSVASFKMGKRLIVSSSSTDTDEGSPFCVVSNDQAGPLTILQTGSLPAPTGYTSVDRSERYFLSVNYQRGILAVYRIHDDGQIGDQVCLRKSPRKEAHCVLTTPDNRFVYVPCVKNNNALFQYSFDAHSGQLTALSPPNAFPPALFGPRHVAYHPSLPVAYFSNEQQLGISVYQIGDDGQLSDRQHATTMPRRSPYEQGKRDLHASDLAVTADGRWLFVAVRDFEGDQDSVFTFGIGSDGRLQLVSRTEVGDIPWKLNLSPDGNFLLVSEAFDHTLAVLRINTDGTLSHQSRINWNAEVRDMVVTSATK